MPRGARLGDLCSGHDHWDPRPNDSASPTVRFNNIPVHRQGDHWVVHCCRYGHDGHDNPPGCHDAVSVRGSPTVRANGIPIMRIGDPVSCGSVVATASPTVWLNGRT